MHEIINRYFFFQAEDGIRDGHVTGVQTCALPICQSAPAPAPAEAAASQAPAAPEKPASAPSASPVTAASADVETINSGDVYAGPAVRRLGRQLGVDLAKVKGTGPRSRVTKDDVRNYVKNIVSASQSGAAPAGGSGIPRPPAVDFSKF